MSNKTKALARKQFLAKFYNLLSYTDEANGLVLIQHSIDDDGEEWLTLVFNTGHEEHICCTEYTNGEVVKYVMCAILDYLPKD